MAALLSMARRLARKDRAAFARLTKAALEEPTLAWLQRQAKVSLTLFAKARGAGAPAS
jgi:hypothetical protein